MAVTLFSHWALHWSSDLAALINWAVFSALNKLKGLSDSPKKHTTSPNGIEEHLLSFVLTAYQALKLWRSVGKARDCSQSKASSVMCLFINFTAQEVNGVWTWREHRSRWLVPPGSKQTADRPPELKHWTGDESKDEYIFVLFLYTICG